MTDTLPAVPDELKAQQLKAIRDSLINTSFQHYNQLIAFLKSLPIPQQQPGMHQAYIMIDSGILWIKEMLTVSPLILGSPTPPAPEEVSAEVDPSL